MQRKLTSDDIANYSSSAKKLYLEEKIPEELCDKLINVDIKAIAKMLDWVNVLEETPTLDKVIEASNYYLEFSIQLPALFESLGFSEAQHKQIKSLGPKLLEIDVLKNTFDLYKKISREITGKSSNRITIENPNALEKLSHLVTASLEQKSDKTNEELAILAESKEMNACLQDKGFVQYLSKSEEQRENEALTKLFESVSQLSSTLKKLSIFKKVDSSEDNVAPENDDSSESVWQARNQ